MSNHKIEAYVTNEQERERIAYLEGQLQTQREDRAALERQLAYVTQERDRLMQDDGARLGLATTEQMVRELISRFKHVSEANININIDRALTLAEMLGGMGSAEREYKTVNND